MCGPGLDPGLRPGAWHPVAGRCFPCAYGEPESPTSPPTRPRSGARHGAMTIETARRASLEFVCVFWTGRGSRIGKIERKADDVLNEIRMLIQCRAYRIVELRLETVTPAKEILGLAIRPPSRLHGNGSIRHLRPRRDLSGKNFLPRMPVLKRRVGNTFPQTRGGGFRQPDEYSQN